MKRIIASTSALLLLAACGASEDEAAVSAAANTPSPEASGQVDPQGETVRILAFGDSLFAGYGVDADESYPAQLEDALRARGLNASVVNAGVSGDTTQAGRDRLAFALEAQLHPPDLLIIELGGNDLLRSIPPEQTQENLRRMLEIARDRDLPVLLFGMRAPPNLGEEFVTRYDAIYGKLAAEFDVPLVPFFLEAIYRDPANFQADRIHPTAAAIETLVAATLDDVIAAIPEETGG